MRKGYLVGLSLLILVTVGCSSSTPSSPGSSGSSSGSSSNAYLGTQSPGDLWSFTISSSTFSASNTPNSLTFSGSVSTLAAGFKKLTVTTTNNSGSVPVSAVGYAYELPGTAMVVKPPATSSDTRAVFLAGTGSFTYSVGYAFQWIVIPSSVWDSTTSNARGDATVTGVYGTSVTLSVNEYMLDGTQTTTAATNTLTNQGSGKVTGSDGTNTLTFQVDSNGSFAGDVAPPSPTTLQVAGFFGMKAPASSISLSSVVQSGRNFRGVVFRNNAASNYTQLAWATGNGATLDAGSYSNVDTNTTSGGVTVAFTSQPSNGEVLGTIDDGTTHTTTFLINQIGGKYVVYGISTDSSTTTPYNLMLIEQ